MPIELNPKVESEGRGRGGTEEENRLLKRREEDQGCSDPAYTNSQALITAWGGGGGDQNQLHRLKKQISKVCNEPSK